MSWRKQASHREETRAVKDALAKAGIKALKVTHGSGTAWGWLHIYLGKNPSGLPHKTMGDCGDTGTPWLCIGDCPACIENRTIERQTIATVQAVTGRKGEYDGEILVLLQD